jgi:type IV pilus assembly protein PilB
VSLVPEPLARRHNLLPFLKIDNELTIVLEDPLNRRAIAEVEQVSGCTVNMCVGLPEEIADKIDQVYGTTHSDTHDISELESTLFTEEELKNIASDFSGESFLRVLLNHTIQMFASSVHFEPINGQVQIRFRLDSGIETVAKISQGWFLVLSTRLKAILDNIEMRDNFMEGVLTHRHKDRRYVFYTSIVGATMGSAITLINLTPKDFPDQFDDLPLSESEREAILQIIGGRAGLAMVVGPGKIEKLKFIDLLLKKKHAKNKKTFVIGSMPWFADSGYIQLKVQVENDAELLEGLKVAVSMDPDIVYVEDLWNQKALLYALQLSVPNTFAMSTLHFPDTLTALEYVNESIDNKTLLTLALKGLVGIHVFRTLCPDCKTRDEDVARQARTLNLPRATVEKETVFKAVGCAKCHGRGYKESKVLVETLRIDNELAEVIKSGPKFAVIEEMIKNKGHRTIREQAMDLVFQGLIGLDDFKNVERR